MKRLTSLLLLAVLAFTACSSTGSSQGNETTTAPESPTAETTTTAPGASSPLSAAELGELFRQALNSGDIATVSALAPTITSQNLQDAIGIGPFETVDCVVLEGRNVCSISNADTPYDFVLDLSTGLVTEIYYTGGG